MNSLKSDPVREITEAELALYRECGWVKLDGLVDGCSAAEMLAKAKSRLMDAAAGSSGIGTDAQGVVQDIRAWTEWRYPTREARDASFAAVALSKAMGRNVQRLLGRDIPVRVWHDIVACKKPAGQNGGSTDTMWHQDLPNWSLDRGGLTMWIALDHIMPEQGVVQYLSGSFHDGPLGRTPKRANSEGVIPDTLAQYPELIKRYQRSPLFSLAPGDVVCHGSLTVHGANANNSQKERWSYLVSYFPDDALYTGAPNGDSDNLGLRLGEPLDLPCFPRAYP